MKILLRCPTALCISAALCAPAFAQDSEVIKAEVVDRGVFAGDWVMVGVGAGYHPSYDGSDDYVLFPMPNAQGSVGGIEFGARGPGLYADLIADGHSDNNVKFLLGPLVRARMDRHSNVKDPIVRLLGKVDVAVEVGARAGVSFSKIISPYDSLTLSSDNQWDVAGAHKERLISPSISYSTPLSTAIFTSVALSATHVDDNYAATYLALIKLEAVQAACRNLTRMAGGKAIAQACLVASICQVTCATGAGVCMALLVIRA